MDGEQTGKRWTSLSRVVDAWSFHVWFTASVCNCYKKKDPKTSNKKQSFKTCKQQHARRSCTLNLYWETGQHSRDWTTCLSSRSFPIWASLTFSLQKLRLCAAGRRASREYCSFNYRCWTNIVVLSHLWGAARFWRQSGLAYDRLPAAIIHLCFVYFCGRYKNDIVPTLISPHSPEAVFAVMNHFIPCSLLNGVEIEQQAFPCQVYCILIFTALQCIKTSNINISCLQERWLWTHHSHPIYSYAAHTPCCFALVLIIPHVILLCSNTKLSVWSQFF